MRAVSRRTTVHPHRSAGKGVRPVTQGPPYKLEWLGQLRELGGPKDYGHPHPAVKELALYPLSTVKVRRQCGYACQIGVAQQTALQGLATKPAQPPVPTKKTLTVSALNLGSLPYNSKNLADAGLDGRVAPTLTQRVVLELLQPWGASWLGGHLTHKRKAGGYHCAPECPWGFQPQTYRPSTR